MSGMFVLFSVLFFWPDHLLAQNTNVITHQLPSATTLPAPLHPLELEVTLRRTRDIGLKLRAFVVRDGKVMDTAPVSSYLSDHGEAVYKFSLSAPVTELSYQFFLAREDGTFETSERYAIRRNCRPNVSTIKLTDNENITGQEKLLALLQQTRGLERDIQNYDRTSQLLQDIKELLRD